MILFLPDAKDGKPHHEHGMIQEFEVGAEVKLSARWTLHAAEVEEGRQLLGLLRGGDHDDRLPARDQRDEAQPAAAGLLEGSGGDQPGPGLQTLGPRSVREDLLDVAAEQRGVVPGASARLLLVPDQRRQLELRTLAERLWGQLLHRNTSRNPASGTSSM